MTQEQRQAREMLTHRAAPPRRFSRCERGPFLRLGTLGNDRSG